MAFPLTRFACGEKVNSVWEIRLDVVYFQQEETMTKNEFETSLRQFLHHEPFRAFVVQLTDGRRLVIHQPPVVFCDGAASYIDPVDSALVDFFHDEVQTFGPLEQEVSV
jgi:hypothetical protein